MKQDEILHDCAYVQHEIDRVRSEKCLGPFVREQREPEVKDGG